MVEFTEAERRFYDELLRKSVTLFEGFIQSGTASKSWLAIFSLLHRLRQTCDHVALTVKSHIDEDDWNTNINSKEAAVASPENITSKIAKKSGGDTIDDNVSHSCRILVRCNLDICPNQSFASCVIAFAVLTKSHG
jgi:SNF2 family DNA or RNA helicase